MIPRSRYAPTLALAPQDGALEVEHEAETTIDADVDGRHL